MTPKVGRSGYVDAADLAEAAVAAGLALTTSAHGLGRLVGDQAGPPPGHAPVIGVGHPAPDFHARNQHGEPVSLAALRGAPVVLVFYPWAFSGICRGELAALRDDHDRFTAAGARVLAVSCDSMFTLRAYADAEGIGFDLLTRPLAARRDRPRVRGLRRRGRLRPARDLRAGRRGRDHLAGGQRDRASRGTWPTCWRRSWLPSLGSMPLTGEYEPSRQKWVRDQVERYEATGGREANTLRDTGLPVVIFTTRGAKSGKIRKIAADAGGA